MKSTVNTKLMGLVRGAFRAVDWAIPKDRDQWVFANTPHMPWGSNQRALYELARSRSEVRADIVELSSVVPMTISGLRDRIRLWRAGVIVVHHGASDFQRLCHARCLSPRVVYNVWHGVNLKGIGFQSAIDPALREKFKIDSNYYTEVIATSESNRESLASGLGIPKERVAVAGLPRNDWLDANNKLPPELAAQEQKLLALLGGRRLLLYAPTFRNASGSGVYAFSDAQSQRLQQVLTDAGFVLGVRAHVNAHGYAPPSWVLDLSSLHFPETSVLLRNTAALLTDYSGIWVDFLLLRRPIVLFTYDRKAYDGDRGLIYDLDRVFPGPLVETFDDLISTVQSITAPGWAFDAERFERSMEEFHTFRDFGATSRVYERVRMLTKPSNGRVGAR